MRLAAQEALNTTKSFLWDSWKHGKHQMEYITEKNYLHAVNLVSDSSYPRLSSGSVEKKNDQHLLLQT
jgi:hypothetical protein